MLQEVSSLSGGEKSFAGLMLLSAITQAAAGIPFHLVDEFDVFQVSIGEEGDFVLSIGRHLFACGYHYGLL